MSPYHAKGIRAFSELQKHDIKHLEELFEKDTPDVEWIGQLAREGDWIIISADVRISRSPAERQAWEESQLTAFFFAAPWPTEKYWTQTVALVTWWNTIATQARKTPRGHGFLMPKGAKELKQIYPVTVRG